MWRKLIAIILLVLVFFTSSSTVYAFYDPTSVPNNRFGIHVVDTSDLDGVASLVNSSGGDWGYVTLVVQKGERDTRRWQDAFNKMRRLHLIPIVRVATAPQGDTWEKPNSDEIDGWVSFFNSLNWVVQNRYIIIGNEPNHAKEWGGEVNPKEYATYLTTFAEKLKAASQDYFTMSAGMDASATNTANTMDEATYLSLMLEAEPKLFDNLDGWSSHSYPNPGFLGSEDGIGRGSVRTYLWELDYLKMLGISKNLPVFITETGWAHNVDGGTGNYLEPQTLGSKFKTAYENAWNNKNVVAVTPFVFSYQDSLFDMFSWKKADGGFYDFYYAVQGLSKTQGKPIQINKGQIISVITPQIGNASGYFYSLIFAENTGQTIWDKDIIQVKSDQADSFEILSLLPKQLEPGHIGIIAVRGKLPKDVGSYKDYFLISDGKPITDKYAFEVKIVPFINMQTIIENIKQFILIKLNLR